jgi:hypothetical protein
VRKERMANLNAESTAYHEAGHAVVGYVLGLEVGSVSIIPDAESQGRVFAPLEDQRRYEIDGDEYLEGHLVTLFAGVKAVELHFGTEVDSDDPNTDLSILQSDYGQAGDIVLTLAGSDPERQYEVSERARGRADSLVCGHWPAVQAVAQALLIRKELSGGELEDLIEGSQITPE